MPTRLWQRQNSNRAEPSPWTHGRRPARSRNRSKKPRIWCKIFLTIITICRTTNGRWRWCCRSTFWRRRWWLDTRDFSGRQSPYLSTHPNSIGNLLFLFRKGNQRIWVKPVTFPIIPDPALVDYNLVPITYCLLTSGIVTGSFQSLP